MTKKRLFIAIDLSDAVREQVYRVCDGIKDVRWTKRGQLHLTLRFIGDTDVDKIPQLVDALSKLDFSSFGLTMFETGFFRPNIFFLSLEESAELLDLKKRIDILLEEVLDMPQETRSFIPHITLSRLKKRLSPPKLKALKQSFAPIFPETFTVNKITLYASELNSNGAIHTPFKIVATC
jgi:RNA 2',3'-cyclic 3'-phosphodiesterase